MDNCGVIIATSPTKTWPAGGMHFTFTNIHYLDCGDNWEVDGVTTSGANEGAAVFRI
jgi:hypothetical protein